MKIRRSRPSIEWTQVPNVVVRDYRISWRARGLLVELLSYPPGWETTIDELVKRAQRQAQKTGGRIEGRDAMRQAAVELKQVGYIVVRRYQDERGRWNTETEVTDAPLWELLNLSPKTHNGTDDGFPGVGVACGDTSVSPGRTEDGFPGVGSPGVGSPGVTKKKETKKEGITPPPSPPHTTPVPSSDGAEEEGEGAKSGDNLNSVRTAEVVAWVEALPWRRHPGRRQREHLARLVEGAQAAGWSPDALRRELLAELDGVRSLYAVWVSRLEQLPAPPLAPVIPLARSAESAGPLCAQHPGAGRRGTECAGCWSERYG